MAKIFSASLPDRVNLDYFRRYFVLDNTCLSKKKGVTACHRNPLDSLWWRRGDLNSRPPPCEGDALPAELLPHMDATTRRSEVCMPFTCRGQVFFARGARRQGGRGLGIRGTKGSADHEAGFSKQEGMGLHQQALRWGSGGASYPPPCSFLKPSLLDREASQALSPGTPAEKQGRSEAGRRANAPTVRAQGGILGAAPSGWQTSRHAGQSPRHSPVRSFRPSPEKNRPGRPVGLGYRKKKRYRSPLVSL